MKINISRHDLGKRYLLGFALAIFGLMTESWQFQAGAILLLAVTWLSDNDVTNHHDQPGTGYMDRAGNPVGRTEANNG